MNRRGLGSIAVGLLLAGACQAEDETIPWNPDRDCASGTETPCVPRFVQSAFLDEVTVDDAFDGVCLARYLVGPGGIPLATGEHADCIVRETLADTGSCPGGGFEIGTDSESGGAVCQVCQQGDGEDPYLVDSLGTDLRPCAGSEAYWLYTTEAEECPSAGKVEFMAGAVPAAGSVVRVECLSEVFAG